MERILISKNSILFFLALILFLILLYFSSSVVLVSIIGIGIGVLINPLLDFSRRKLHLPRALSALIIMLFLILVFAVILWCLYYLIADQVSSLEERWPEIQRSSDKLISNSLDKFPDLRNKIVSFNFSAYAKQTVLGLLEGLKSGAVAISSAIFALIIGLYTAVNGKEYFSNIVEAFYPKYRKEAHRVLSKCAQSVRLWFKAQLIDMVIIGLLTGAGLWIAGVEYWAIFGLLTAVLGIIPYVGIIIVVIAASLITLASDPSKVPWIIGIFAVTQQLEGDVILPMVMKGGAEIPVVPLLIFMLFLGNFLGILGVFISPPLLAVIKTLYVELYLKRLNEKKEYSFN